MSGGAIGTDPKVIKGVENLQKNRIRDIIISSLISGIVGSVITYLILN